MDDNLHRLFHRLDADKLKGTVEIDSAGKDVRAGKAAERQLGTVGAATDGLYAGTDPHLLHSVQDDIDEYHFDHLTLSGPEISIKNLDTADKKVIIPHDKVSAYLAHENWPDWASFIEEKGFRLLDDLGNTVRAGQNGPSTLPNPNWDSEDTPWKRGGTE